jgi:hypothetical protein
MAPIAVRSSLRRRTAFAISTDVPSPTWSPTRRWLACSRRDLAADVRPLAPVLEALAPHAKPDTARRAWTILAGLRYAKEGAPARPPRPSFETDTFESLSPGASFAASNAGLAILRELMREVGAVHDPATPRALGQGPPTDLGGPAIQKYVRPSTELVTPSECRVVEHCLLAHLDVVREVATFFDDAPRGSELTAWVTLWADFHGRAAALGGHRQLGFPET